MTTTSRPLELDDARAITAGEVDGVPELGVRVRLDRPADEVEAAELVAPALVAALDGTAAPAPTPGVP